MNHVIYSDKTGSWQIIKNPRSLAGLGSKCRGIVLASGDIYVENQSDGTIHNDILRILYDLGILKGVFKKNWTLKLPAESGFLTVQRYQDKNLLAIGESNRLLYREDDYRKNIEHYKDFLQCAIQKHPSINFAFKLIGIKDPSIERSNVVVICPQLLL